MRNWVPSHSGLFRSGRNFVTELTQLELGEKEPEAGGRARENDWRFHLSNDQSWQVRATDIFAPTLNGSSQSFGTWTDEK